MSAELNVSVLSYYVISSPLVVEVVLFGSIAIFLRCDVHRGNPSRLMNERGSVRIACIHSSSICLFRSFLPRAFLGVLLVALIDFAWFLFSFHLFCFLPLTGTPVIVTCFAYSLSQLISHDVELGF